MSNDLAIAAKEWAKTQQASRERRNFQEVLFRLKCVLGVEQDQEVASQLGLSKSALSERARRGSFPVNNLMRLKVERPDLDIDVDYILTGERATDGCGCHHLTETYGDHASLNSSLKLLARQQGSRLWEERIEQYSEKEVALAVGVEPEAISLWEKGEGSIPSNKLYALHKQLGFDFYYILTGERLLPERTGNPQSEE